MIIAIGTLLLVTGIVLVVLSYVFAFDSEELWTTLAAFGGYAVFATGVLEIAQTAKWVIPVGVVVFLLATVCFVLMALFIAIGVDTSRRSGTKFWKELEKLPFFLSLAGFLIFLSAGIAQFVVVMPSVAAAI